MATEDVLPAWAAWSEGEPDRRGRSASRKRSCSSRPRRGCPPRAARTCSAPCRRDVGECARAETHGSALELATAPSRTVGEARWRSSPALRDVARRARSTGSGCARPASGTHPTARWEDVDVSPGARYQFVHASMRELARREPTFGLHVHVAVPEAETALRALNAIRGHLPVLLALSANSPFWQGRDSGLASARTPIFQAFPRTGPPRWFSDYADYVEAIDVLRALRRHPRADVPVVGRAAPAALRDARGADHGLADARGRHRRDRGARAVPGAAGGRGATRPSRAADAPEVLSENRFLAARDGMEARLVEPAAWRRRPVRDRLAELVDACAPYARALGLRGRAGATSSGSRPRPGPRVSARLADGRPTTLEGRWLAVARRRVHLSSAADRRAVDVA